MARLAAAEQSAATNHLALQTMAAEGVNDMSDIELEPKYSTKEIPGKCIKCLAEQESRNCLWELLKGEGQNKELEKTYEAMLTLLTSSELENLRDESEKYLAEGKNVKILIHLGEDKPRYEIKID